MAWHQNCANFNLDRGIWLRFWPHPSLTTISCKLKAHICLKCRRTGKRISNFKRYGYGLLFESASTSRISSYGVLNQYLWSSESIFWNTFQIWTHIDTRGNLPADNVKSCEICISRWPPPFSCSASYYYQLLSCPQLWLFPTGLFSTPTADRCSVDSWLQLRLCWRLSPIDRVSSSRPEFHGRKVQKTCWNSLSSDVCRKGASRCL